jgi:two-component system nitrate/nitrite response regulator NarL
MGELVTTILVEPRHLVREAFAAMIRKHSFRVLQSVGSVAELADGVSLRAAPKLVIVGQLAAADAATEVACIRKLWPETKIVLLAEYASATDRQILLTMPIEGCVPLCVSPDTLMRALSLIMSQEHRVLVLDPMKGNVANLKDSAANGAVTAGQCSNVGEAAISVPTSALLRIDPPEAAGNLTSLSARMILSEREAQIVKMLTKGHSNKVIARLCDLTEARIKVHLKSILRKLRLENRTQAALWAVEHAGNAPAASISM